jgi:cytochrome c oxidase subunit 2
MRFISNSRKRQVAFTLLALLLVGCAGSPSALDPQGPAAARIAGLWWFLLGLGGFVYVAVVAFLLFALFRRRRHGNSESGLHTGSRIVLYAGIITPALILLVVFGFTVAALNALSMPDTAERYTVHVIGHQWWWEIRYPEEGVITANEIHIPAGQPVRILLSSDDVIHSFWVPQLHGKLDLVPGQTNQIWLQADRPGTYVGECAEFCGIQHANMRLLVIAEPPEQFDSWAEAQRQPTSEPTDSLVAQGQQLFLGTTCLTCHTIAGTHATGRLGPDLTHFASRRTLASATLANNRGNLAGWIANPQHLKPGALMPSSELTGSELQALLAYLTTLK